MEELVGKTLGQYELKEKIGEGGMAHVFKAYQPSLSRFVALKILAPAVAEKKGFTERFQREARSVAHLNHPNIVPVYDFGVQDSYNYIVMRYVERSRTLGDLIEESAPLGVLIDYIIQVADALNYAHEQKVIHRDVKPSNILVDGKWALLSDFGLVKMSESVTHLTISGHTLGTPAYMSPEQVEGIHVDHRTDIYALGIILYRILTGTIPHEAPTPIGMLVKRQTEPVPSPCQIKPDIPKSLEQVTLRSLAMKPDNRYSSAASFAQALKKAQINPNYREKLQEINDGAEDKTQVGEITLPRIIKSYAAKRRPLSFLAGGIIAALLIVGILVFFGFFLLRGNDDSLATPETSQNKTLAGADTPVIVGQTAASALPPLGTPLAIAQTKLEIRSGPSSGYDLLGYLLAKTVVEITGRDETEQWWQIKTGLTPTGVGWIKGGDSLVETLDSQNVPIALAPPTPTTTAQSAPDMLTLAVTPPTTIPPTSTRIPVTPTATPGNGGLGQLTLWGSNISGSLGGRGQEQWFVLNSNKETDATLIVFMRNVEQVRVILYHGRDIPQWPPANPDDIANLGIASEQGNRDQDDRTREFVWQGPVTPNTRYYVRLVNQGGTTVQYCFLTRPDRDRCF